MSIRICQTQPKSQEKRLIQPRTDSYQKMRRRMQRQAFGHPWMNEEANNYIQYRSKISTQSDNQKSASQQKLTLIQVTIGALVLILLLLFISSFFGSTNCTALYKEGRCWEATRSSEPNCQKLAKCVGQEGSRYREQIMATLAGLIIILRRYWREVLEIAHRIKV